MMNENTAFVAMVVLAAIAIAAICYGAGAVGSDFGRFEATEDFRKEAVAHGCAEFVMNPTNGVSTWRWK